MNQADDMQTQGHRQAVGFLRNHWTRPLGPLGYYWFLTFEKSPELRALSMECQSSLDFPYYDLAPSDSLHLTLARVADVKELTPGQIHSIGTSAKYACQSLSPFDIETDRLSGVQSAIAFDVRPTHPVLNLRDTLRSATLAACPEISIGLAKPHPPHITIAYANSDGVSAADSMLAIKNVNEIIRKVNIEVTEAAMVLLERRQCSYSWQVVSRIPLTGPPGY
jgi:2'-5' RNA ligase